MRLIDAEYIKAVMLNDRLMQGNAEFTLYAQQVETQVNALPSIEIIRCRECKYCDKGSDRVTGQTVLICQRKNDENLWEKMNTDDFCSYGEREGE